jgi:hypothetical protein
MVVANIIDGVTSGTVWPFAVAGLVTACAGCGLYASRRGKFAVWAELLARLASSPPPSRSVGRSARRLL